MTEALERAYNAADGNKKELRKVVAHYAENENDSLKLRAPIYLIENMPEHRSMDDPLYQKYAVRIQTMDMPISTPDLNNLWDPKHRVSIIEDLQKMCAADLISDIDAAFSIRNSSPWKDSVSFKVFMEYILPYKVSEEAFVPEWRKTLNERYNHLVKNVHSPMEAFVIVKKHIRSQSREVKSNFRYGVDPLTMDYLRRGSCSQLDAYTIAVLRALHIPTSYDYIEGWGNYSQVGHSWPAYVSNDLRTYTLADKDSVLRNNNPIDASFFKEHAEPINYPLEVSQYKTVYKVYRKTFARAIEDNSEDKGKSKLHVQDVSAWYGLNANVELDFPLEIDYATLSVFRTGNDWTEIDIADNFDGKVKFHNLGKKVIYLVTAYDSLGLKRIGTPFYIDDNFQQVSFPVSKERMPIVLYRKYPLFGHWTAQWQKMIGGVLEVGQTPDFQNPKTVFRIEDVPVGRIDIASDQYPAFSCIRYRCPPKSRTPIAEMVLYDFDGNIIEGGVPVGDKIAPDQWKLAFDGNILTNPETKNEEYWIGLDFTENEHLLKKLARIELIPKNDGNFIVPEDDYELYYFDKRWIKLFEKKATTDSLAYLDAPRNAVFLLRNRSRGVEERIFTMENGRQIWW